MTIKDQDTIQVLEMLIRNIELGHITTVSFPVTFLSTDAEFKLNVSGTPDYSLRLDRKRDKIVKPTKQLMLF